MIVGQKADQVQVMCTNCLEYINSDKIDLHESYCFRNLYRCQKCNQMVDKHERESHDQTMHSKTKCKDCNQLFEGYALEKHANVCPLKPQRCEYCELDIKGDEYQDHVAYCGARTQVCDQCNKNIILKDFQKHQSTCVGQQQNIPDEIFQAISISKEDLKKRDQETIEYQEQRARENIPVQNYEKYRRYQLREQPQLDPLQEIKKNIQAPNQPEQQIVNKRVLYQDKLQRHISYEDIEQQMNFQQKKTEKSIINRIPDNLGIISEKITKIPQVNNNIQQQQNEQIQINNKEHIRRIQSYQENVVGSYQQSKVVNNQNIMPSTSYYNHNKYEEDILQTKISIPSSSQFQQIYGNQQSSLKQNISYNRQYSGNHNAVQPQQSAQIYKRDNANYQQQQYVSKDTRNTQEYYQKVSTRQINEDNSYLPKFGDDNLQHRQFQLQNNYRRVDDKQYEEVLRKIIQQPK